MSTPESPTARPWMTYGGWAATALSGLMMTGSAAMKLTANAMVVDQLVNKGGFGPGVVFPLGVVELASTLLYLVPRTATLGAVLLTGYLGGAVATHLRMGEPVVAPVVIGMVVWLGLFLRDFRVRALLPLS